MELTTIKTVYLPATTTRPRRIKATTMSDRPTSVTISEPIEDMPHLDWHRAAADALCKKMGWKNKLVAGATANGFIFVQIPNVQQCFISGHLMHDGICLRMDCDYKEY